MASPGYFDRKTSSNTRSGLASLQQDPSSPHTPTRPISSAVSSPSLSYRIEEEPLIFEIGTRHLSAGFAGEVFPRCTLGFGPEESRRVGDYRRWLPGGEENSGKRHRMHKWGRDHELWRMDLRDVDLNLIEDKIERAVREAYTRYLLLDYKSTKKLILILPSVIPHQLLNIILSCFFQNPPSPPSITLLSPTILTTTAAGCRSSLIVDIGWTETVVTAVYEYREVNQKRTTRAMQKVTAEMAQLLEQEEKKADHDRSDEGAEESRNSFVLAFEQVEEIFNRFAWCKSRDNTATGELQDRKILIPSPGCHDGNLLIPFSAFAKPVEKWFFLDDPQRQLDDQEQPLHTLIYKSLQSLPPDARALCMSRIIVTGGGSNIPGLKGRLLEEVSAIVENRGWDQVSGRVPDERRRRLKEINHNIKRDSIQDVVPEPKALQENHAPSMNTIDHVPPHAFIQTLDLYEDTYGRERDKGSKPVVSGVIRLVDSLGAWSGASLLGGLRIKGIAEIEKEAFLQHGLAGARKDASEISVAPPKGLGSVASKAGERLSWTLGAWA